MLGICRLRPTIVSYPWGSRTGIAAFLGRRPAEEPEAELWMGAHPKAPSEVEVDGRWTSLAALVEAAPQDVLGRRVADRHGSGLPFLFKVLAAGRALSIQAHPDRRQAAAGCRREDRLGIPRDAPRRNYRDASHKPEILYALTPFSALRGFRPAAEAFELMAQAGVAEALPEACAALRAGDLKGFFTAYMALDQGRVAAVLAAALETIAAAATDDGAFARVLELARQFPGDRGVLAPLYLHLLELEPGQALFTGPGVLHAYLEGVGLELMASSDNVVRGGLTDKHVDVAELLAILRFETQPPRLLSSTVAAGERRFETVEGLQLSVIDVREGLAHERGGGRSVEILLCGEGRGVVREVSRTAEVAFTRGDALLVPATVPGYRTEGDATLYRAAVAAGV